MESVPPAKKTNPFIVAGVVACTSIVLLFVTLQLDRFGKYLYEDGCVTEAIWCYQVGTGISSLLGIRDLELANAWTELSVCYAAVPRFRDAIVAQRKAIDIRRQLLGPEHPSVVLLQANLASYQAKSGDLAGAERSLSELLERSRSRVPQEEYSLGFVLGALTDCYLKEDKLGEAETTARELADLEPALQSRLQLSLDGRERLVLILAKEGKLTEAEQVAREGVLSKRNLIPDNQPSIARAYESLAKVLLAEKKGDDAKTQFGLALNSLQQKYGNADVKIAWWRARFQRLTNADDPFKENSAAN